MVPGRGARSKLVGANPKFKCISSAKMMGYSSATDGQIEVEAEILLSKEGIRSRGSVVVYNVHEYAGARIIRSTMPL